MPVEVIVALTVVIFPRFKYPDGSSILSSYEFPGLRVLKSIYLTETLLKLSIESVGPATSS